MAWRIALMCLLALALSVKGFAAQATMLCESSHHLPALQQQTQDPCAELGHAMPDESVDQAASDAQAEPCSADADCCSGGAIMSDFGAETMSAPIQMRGVATIPRGTARLLIGGLERPPRIHSLIV